MSVQRNKDGSVTIKSNNGIISIGRIIRSSVTMHEDRFKQWVEDCAKLVTACYHTFMETEAFFLKQCDALPLTKDDKRMTNFQLNLVMNNFTDKLEHKAPVFTFEMTDEEMEEWYKEKNAMRNEVMSTSPEKFGLNIRGYYLPQTERNKAFYVQPYLELQKKVKNINPMQIQKEDICFFFEESTGYIQSTGGGNELMRQLIFFRGVSEEDIKTRNPHFLEYISTLRDMGILPGILEE